MKRMINSFFSTVVKGNSAPGAPALVTDLQQSRYLLRKRLLSWIPLPLLEHGLCLQVLWPTLCVQRAHWPSDRVVYLVFRSPCFWCSYVVSRVCLFLRTARLVCEWRMRSLSLRDSSARMLLPVLTLTAIRCPMRWVSSGSSQTGTSTLLATSASVGRNSCS